MIFEEIKAAVDMPTVARGYGLKINRSGMAICPFHREKTPSAKIYPDGFHCFGCGVHADVIGFTQRLFDLRRPIDAARKLNDDFMLNFDVGSSVSATAVNDYRRRQREREEYERWENEAWLTLSSYYKLLREWRELAPDCPDDEPNRRFIYALHNLHHTEYLCEEFIAADEDGRKAMRVEVERIAGFFRRLDRRVQNRGPCKAQLCGGEGGAAE